MRQKLTYHISGHTIELFSDFPERLKMMLYGFDPFLAEVKPDKKSFRFNAPILQFVVHELQDVKEMPLPKTDRDIVHIFDIEKGKCTLSRCGNKFNFTIEEEGECLPLVLDMEQDSSLVYCTCVPASALNFGHLKFSFWMAMAFAGIPRQTVSLHASVAVYNDQAILFLGESGTGKSTHTKLWLDHIPGSRLLNDDSPIVRIEHNEENRLVPFVYGSPWSGKGRCYINERYPIAAFVRLQQHTVNKITRLNKLEAFGALYPSFPPAFLKDDYFEGHICAIISTILKTTPVCRLQCLPDSAAAELVKNTVFEKDVSM